LLDVMALIGQAMLVAGPALVVVGILAVLPAVLRVRRRAVALAAAVTALRQEGASALVMLRARRGEMEQLLVPWRRLLRWARHPLVVATVEWHWRRRRRRRSGHG
jgi:hypothetical protein